MVRTIKREKVNKTMIVKMLFFVVKHAGNRSHWMDYTEKRIYSMIVRI